MKFINKLTLSLVTVVVVLLNIVSPALAQTPTPGASSNPPGPWYNQQLDQFAGKVFGGDQNEIFGERYTYAQTSWVFMSVLLSFYNFATQGKLSGCLTTAATGNAQTCIDEAIAFIQNGSTPSLAPTSQTNNLNSFVASIFEDRPMSGITYIKNIGRKFNIVPEAKAQTTGFGYGGALTFGGNFNGIQDFWTTMRNFSYVVFVVITIVFAFMIMFRLKISPQVVITVQSALPKIAITLILVTFSYAIAGLLIDLMYVVIGIFSLVFSQITVFGISDSLGSGTPLGAIGYFDLLTKGPAFLNSGSGIFGMLIMYWTNFFAAAAIVGFGGILAGFSSTVSASCNEAILSGLAQGGLGFIFLILYLIGLVVLIIVSIINFFRIIWLLARTFLMIVLLTIFAPIQLTLGAVIPQLSFGSWVKSYISKLAIFVGVGVTFILALWFLQQAWQVIAQSIAVSLASSACPLYPDGWPPLFGGSPQMLSFLFMLASFGVFCMIPNVGNMIESLLSGKPFNYGSAINEIMNPVKMGGQYISSNQESRYADNVSKGLNTTADDRINAALNALGRVGLVKRRG